MDSGRLERLLDEVHRGTLPVPEAVSLLRSLTFEDLGFAKIDTHRDWRTGFPEVIFCQGKTPAQVVAIAQAMCPRQRVILATRVAPEAAAALQESGLEGRYYETARIWVWPAPPPPSATPGYVLVVCAGTADLPVAEEAAVTAEIMGSRVERLYDVGVAGIHRLLHFQEKLAQASILVVVAGMEGALPSVVSGLVDRPVIGVPTSVGYGAHFGGLAPLLAMLNSCATGLAVVNIDNGFGAGYFAHLVNARSLAEGPVPAAKAERESP